MTLSKNKENCRRNSLPQQKCAKKQGSFTREPFFHSKTTSDWTTVDNSSSSHCKKALKKNGSRQIQQKLLLGYWFLWLWFINRRRSKVVGLWDSVTVRVKGANSAYLRYLIISRLIFIGLLLFIIFPHSFPQEDSLSLSPCQQRQRGLTHKINCGRSYLAFLTGGQARPWDRPEKLNNILESIINLNQDRNMRTFVF